MLKDSYNSFNSHFDNNLPNALMEHIMTLYLYSSTSISKSNTYNGLSAIDSCIVKETLMQNCYTEIIIMYSNMLILIYDTMKITY